MIHFLLFFSFSINCSDSLPEQMICYENASSPCILDAQSTFQCYVFPSTECDGERSFNLTFPCRYCFQLPLDQLRCESPARCRLEMAEIFAPCSALSRCVGNPVFNRRTKCTYGTKSQSTAFLLSLFLGIFGADRFYLGHIATGVFKLLTLGGAGIAYVIDLMLIITGYLTPYDGSGFYERF